ncbi:MAG: DUF6489 family protein [Chromatiaceae bacterium]|jgi:hypothetical protein|nr:DUF6489 family protein [Chromatiaceae bacterium]
MNLKIDIDITPEEMRKLFGLPDVEDFQRQLMDDIRQRMREGAEGYDPIKLFQPYVSGTLASWEAFQKLFAAAVPPGARTKGGGD